MQRLWAPWRMAYLSKKIKGCFFCEYLRRRNDRKNLIVQRSQYSFSILNLYPYNNGHIMVVPKRHVKDLHMLSLSEREDLINLFIATKKLCQKVLRPGGFNCGINFGRAAGAGLESHLHIHLVPRWIGDTNFMPILSGTKVVSQSLRSLYQRLTENLKRSHSSV